MTEVTIRRIGDCDPYQGPGAIDGIRFRALGRELGITAWGMNVLEIEAGCTGYPEHDHANDGQEEVYVVLAGSGKLVSSEGEFAMETGMLFRVGPGAKRKLLSGREGLTVLAIGGTPGKAYQAPR